MVDVDPCRDIISTGAKIKVYSKPGIAVVNALLSPFTLPSFGHLKGQGNIHFVEGATGNCHRADSLKPKPLLVAERREGEKDGLGY